MYKSIISNEDKDLFMMVRELVQEHIKPRASEFDAKADDDFDWSAVDLLSKHNLLAPIIPENYGGRGLSHLTTAVLLEEIAYGCAGVAMVIATNLHAISPILAAGTEEQRQEFLPKFSSDKRYLGALAMTERLTNLNFDNNDDLANIHGSSIMLEEGKEKTVLRGYKDFVMNGRVASFISTLVSSTSYIDKSGLQVVILPTSTPGIILGKERPKLGLRYCNLNELIFDNVILDDKYRVGKRGSGFLVVMQNLDRMVPLISAIGVGIARAAYETALEASKNRFVMGKPSFEESAVSFSLVDMATKINAARLSAHLACWLIDNDLDYSQASSKAKILSSKIAQEITPKAMELTGGKAYEKGHISEKYLRDAKMLSLIDGSEQFHMNLLSAQLL